MCMLAGVFRHHVAGEASWTGVTLASPTGSGVDLRAVAGLRQKGEWLWVVCWHYSGRLCEGHSCCGLCCVRLHRAFRRARCLICVQGPVCVHHGIFLFPVHSLIVAHVAPASLFSGPLSDGCRLAFSCTSCRKSSLEGAFRCLALAHGFVPSVVSTSKWRAFRPRRHTSQVAPGGTGPSVPVGR